MTSALLTLTFSAAAATAAVAVRARLVPRPVTFRAERRPASDDDWRPRVSSGCGR